MTPSGIEPTTVRFVAQYLNHCAIAVPHLYLLRSSSLSLNNMSDRTSVSFEKLTGFGTNSLMLRFGFCPHTLNRWMVDKYNLKGLPNCRLQSRGNFKLHAFFDLYALGEIKL
jgi:hypothetical protein